MSICLTWFPVREMKGMQWLEEKGENSGMMDTYVDTKKN